MFALVCRPHQGCTIGWVSSLVVPMPRRSCLQCLVSAEVCRQVKRLYDSLDGGASGLNSAERFEQDVCLQVHSAQRRLSRQQQQVPAHMEVSANVCWPRTVDYLPLTPCLVCSDHGRFEGRAVWSVPDRSQSDNEGRFRASGLKMQQHQHV